MMDRYERQIVLPEIGQDGQRSLKGSNILIVGMGGLGCPAAQYLTGAGVGSLTLVDGDVVSKSNLHRQVLYREGEIGQPKVACAARSLKALNADCTIVPVSDPLTPATAVGLAAESDVVLDCADSFAVSYILSDTCKVLAKPLISASALGTSGYVGAFCARAPSLRAVFPDLPDTTATCATAGVMGPVVGVLGAMQAQIAMSLVLGTDPSPMGHLRTLDGLTLKTGGFNFLTAREPDTPPLTFVSPGDIQPDDFVVELRNFAEAPLPVTEYAHRLSVPDFSSDHRPAPACGQRAVMCCRSGLRAWRAARALQTYWDGHISLLAMGDMPNPSSTKETP